MITDNVIIGTHATDSVAAREILENGFNPSTANNSWLGEGVYFWQDTYHRALIWLNQSKALRNADVAEVLQVEVDARAETTLDLIDARFTEKFARFAQSYIEDVTTRGGKLMKNYYRDKRGIIRMTRHLDCHMINMMVEFWEERNDVRIEVVRSCFVQGKAIFPTSMFRTDMHVQLAVREPDVIASVEKILGTFKTKDIMKYVNEKARDRDPETKGGDGSKLLASMDKAITAHRKWVKENPELFRAEVDRVIAKVVKELEEEDEARDQKAG